MVLLSWQLAFRMTWTKACATKIIGPSKHCILTSHVVQMFRRCFFLCCCHWQECLPVHDSKIPTLQASLGREGQLFVILIKLGNLTWNNVSLIWYGYIANIMFFCLLVFTERIIGLWTETLESFNVFFLRPATENNISSAVIYWKVPQLHNSLSHPKNYQTSAGRNASWLLRKCLCLEVGQFCFARKKHPHLGVIKLP